MVQCHKLPLKLDLDPLFLSRELLFQGTISQAKHRRNVFMAGTEYFGEAVQPRDHIPCQHHAEITQSRTFAELIRVSTTTHNRV